MFLQSKILLNIPGVIHGFGNRSEPVPSQLKKYWERKAIWNQVHGVELSEIVEPNQNCGPCDGFYCEMPGLPIAVASADCVPILLAKRTGDKVGALHAGWKGTKAQIVKFFFKKLASLGENPKDWVAAIGPSIGPCCYEVSEELARDFAKDFPEPGLVRGRYVDLPGINEYQLKEAGVALVDVLRECTGCVYHDKSPAYYSYRKYEDKLRQYGVVLVIENP